MLAHSFLIKSSWKLLVTRTGIKARMSLISGLWFPWPIYMFLKWDLTLAHWTQVSDRCPLGYLFFTVRKWQCCGFVHTHKFLVIIAGVCCDFVHTYKYLVIISGISGSWLFENKNRVAWPELFFRNWPTIFGSLNTSANNYIRVLFWFSNI